MQRAGEKITTMGGWQAREGMDSFEVVLFHLPELTSAVFRHYKLNGLDTPQYISGVSMFVDTRKKKIVSVYIIDLSTKEEISVEPRIFNKFLSFTSNTIM